MSETKDQQSNQLELVASRIGEQEFCIDIQSVREIRGWTPATVLPHAPAHVVGVINLRGTVLPVVDLAMRLSLGRSEPTARHVIIVVQVGKKMCGLLVDAVSEILTVAPDRIQPTPDVDSELAHRFVGGVIADKGRMLSVIRLQNTLSDFEEAA
jgi:purine-binding chemotaxis protein CheW